MSDKKSLSRRQFLAAAATSTAVAVVGLPAVSAGNAALPTAQDGEGISFLVRPDIRSAYAVDHAVEQWNAAYPDRPVTIDEPAGGGVDTKIQAAIAAGDLIWDGYAVVVGPHEILNWVNRELMVPLDELIETSSIPGASEVVPGIIPSVLESSKFDGKQYLIPGNVGSVALGWFTEPLEAAGVEPPETWDEVRFAAEAVAATSPDLTPYDAACQPLCDLIGMIWGATDTPLTEEGLIDWQGEASIDAINWLTAMAADGLMPTNHSESFGNWLKGGTAIMSSFDVHGTMAQQTFGDEMASTGVNIVREKGDPKSGAPFWLNGSAVLNGANNPQGMMDFLLWWFGPDNEDNGRQITEVAAKPAYQYTYDQFVADNPVQHWQIAGIELVRDSVPFPVNLFWGIQNSVVGPWLEQALAGDMSAEDAMFEAMNEIAFEMDDLL